MPIFSEILSSTNAAVEKCSVPGDLKVTFNSYKDFEKFLSSEGVLPSLRAGFLTVSYDIVGGVDGTFSSVEGYEGFQKKVEPNKISKITCRFALEAASIIYGDPGATFEHEFNRDKSILTSSSASSVSSSMSSSLTEIDKKNLREGVIDSKISRDKPLILMKDKASNQDQRKNKIYGENSLFLKGDLDYTGYSEKEKGFLKFAENGCDFPKLALFLSSHVKIGSMSGPNIAKAINDTYKKLESPETLSPEQVLEVLENNKNKPKKK